MFRFSNPEYLYFLVILPILLVVEWMMHLRQRKRLRAFGNPVLLAQLMPDVSLRRPIAKTILQLMALTVAVFMVAGPQFGSKKETVKRRSAELMIALDISNSMMAEDVLPSRLEKSKQVVSRLVDRLDDDRIGLVVFAGEAYTQLPITSDYISAKVFLNTLSPDLIQTQGTAIGAAIDLCVRSFGPQGDAGRAIIVITDGEDFEGDAVSSAQKAVENGIQVHVIGMGDPKGSPIPTGKGINDFRKDKEGQVVITKLNESMGQEIAAAGQGTYIRADNSNAALRSLIQTLDNMTKSEVEAEIYTAYDEQFQGLAWFVFVLLLLDIFLLERKDPRLKNVKLF